ncbi:tRNA pseudouridine(38-40) synthase TruA [Cytobacillus solani]|uniref:tRNA pseudouridine synthase A n=1 Tax=Cytobacillus solani TaxID=1637975 RepID=A0A0Q3RCU0_9BACI|nr:tRNA pseudouridine(38-40) synthase TruA [Cytobacillus solani]KOP72235.1 tRNA pseudouridine synthase A [Bacillus sp. FJAT-21945]KQL27489.1 tRNA pseudouridine synthase A [Cytobacillus solani]
MQRYKCIISYDGTQFAGYQVQPNKRTVQGEVEKALRKLHKDMDVKVSASGRTDAGVHARGQVIHFDSPLKIPLEKWEVALNTLLPEDIAIIHTEMAADDFHARFDAKGKEYRYFVYRSLQRSPFKRNYAYQYPYSLDIKKVNEAVPFLIGEHDFTSFCSAKTDVVDKVREIRKIEVVEEGDMLIFRFVGNGFLYNMVRILVGTLLGVGAGDISPGSIPDILEKRDRVYAGKTAPAQGLYLWEVHY